MRIGMQLGLVTALYTLLATLSFAGESQWFLLSREGECITLDRLAKREKLLKTPATPEAFASMMRDRGYQATLGLPEGFPEDLRGKVIQVRVHESMMPIFAREEVCHQVEK